MLERFGVGRGSLREALRILEVNGLVVLKPGPRGGPVVAPFDPAHFGQMMTLHLQALGTTYRQLLDSRVEYEAVLARKAAEREGDEAGAIMRAAMTGDPAQSGDDTLYSAATGGFHSAVGLASGNPVLALAADAIYAIWSVRVTRVLSPGPARGRPARPRGDREGHREARPEAGRATHAGAHGALQGVLRGALPRPHGRPGRLELVEPVHVPRGAAQDGGPLDGGQGCARPDRRVATPGRTRRPGVTPASRSRTASRDGVKASRATSRKGARSA